MEKKTGVYICTGCGIGEALDVEALEKVAAEEYQAAICARNEVLCSQEGAGRIKADLESGQVDSLVIAACSSRVMSDVFDFGNIVMDRVNLREQVVWSQLPDTEREDTQILAEDYLRMGLIKVAKMELPEGFKGPEGDELGFSKDVLVIGGGMAGLSAALDAAGAGCRVTLVEKEDSLGGWAAKWKLSTPSRPPYQELEETGVGELIAQVEANDKIKVMTQSRIAAIDGGPGLFDTTIRSDGSESTARFGSVVLAAGWTPYDPNNLTFMGYGLSPDVITNVQLEELAAAGDITRPSNGAAPEAVLFVQCAGSRDQNHLPYCSAVCCRASLKQALYLKQQNPEMAVYIFYKDLRSPGQDEELYRQAQKAGVIFFRGETENIKVQAAGDKLGAQFKDALINDDVELDELDLVVLAAGMVPNTRFGEDIKAELRAAQEAQAKEREAAKAAAAQEAAKPKKVKKGKKAKKAKAAAATEEEPLPVPLDVIYASDILNLGYRQGPELPDLKYGFPDSHYICFPYETRRTGIYAAGCVRRPMNMSSAQEDAGGAALKAIQCMEATSQGMAVHPRSGDLSFPEINLSRCTQCRRCTDECPFGALNEDEKSNPLTIPTRCRRCGTCMGACPERIISFKNYNVDMIGSMIKAVSVPESDAEKPRVLIFACENDSYPALDMAGLNRLPYSPYIRVVPLRCLGSLNLVWIADALGSGFDGVMLFGCRHGDDYQCHFIRGSELANIRMSKITETLTRLQLEPERIRVEEISIADWERVPQIIGEFMETMDRVGPNPFKDL